MGLMDPESKHIEANDSVDSDYVRRIYDLARICGGTPIFNASLGHAAVVIERIMANACTSVSILSGSLDPRVYGRSRVLKETMQFLNREHCELRIILEGKHPEALKHNAFLERFKDHARVSLRFMPEREQARYNFHFVVADGESYRIEADKSKVSAVVAFGHLQGALNLERVFAILWDLAEAPPPTELDAAAELC